ncbi:MAG: hypothetical protein WC899_10635 [bacterium]|jgi:hypothetical protein
MERLCDFIIRTLRKLGLSDPAILVIFGVLLLILLSCACYDFHKQIDRVVNAIDKLGKNSLQLENLVAMEGTEKWQAQPQNQITIIINPSDNLSGHDHTIYDHDPRLHER